MKQADQGLSLTTKGARQREFSDDMNRLVPWAALVKLLVAHAPEGKGRPPFPVETTLRIHFMKQWFTLGYPVKQSLHDVPLTQSGRKSVDKSFSSGLFPHSIIGEK